MIYLREGEILSATSEGLVALVINQPERESLHARGLHKKAPCSLDKLSAVWEGNVEEVG